jgi:hypothetical protein
MSSFIRTSNHTVGDLALSLLPYPSPPVGPWPGITRMKAKPLRNAARHETEKTKTVCRRRVSV